jgi:hydrophobic/amphiphilic exporter-1 (mainly G- bacteria), HAE1 family
MSLTRLSIDNSVVVGILTAVVIAAGILGSSNLGIVFVPDITAPTIAINATYSGASPAEMEQLVVKPIEDQIIGLHNEDTMQATVQDGEARIEVQLLLGADVDAALTDVQHRVDAARMYLPADLDPPVVTKHFVGGGPILTEAVSSVRMSAGALSDLVSTQIEDALRAVLGVEGVVAQGTQASEFHVEPDPQRLAAVEATLSDLYTLLGGDNVTYPGGRIAGTAQETSVAVHGDVHTAADLAALPVQVGPGSLVRVRDVATVDLGHVEPRIITHVDGVGAIVLQVSRAQGADEVRTTASVRKAFAEIARGYPDLMFREITNSADLTTATVVGVEQSLLEGVVLTACVLMLALHAWRSALVVLVAIPTSLLATVCAMWVLGFTLDLSSTMGLSLAIGILVDDSIVVLENQHPQFALGRDRRSAAIVGRTQIGTAAVAITLVDVVVFLPIGFAAGLVGRVLREFGLVVAFATLVSLLVSFTLTPLLAARWSLRSKDDALERRLRSMSARFGVFARWYIDRVLPWALARRAVVMVTCVLLLLGSLALVPLGFIGAEVMPSSENGGLTAALTYRVGTPIGTTEAGTERLAAAIRHTIPVTSVLTTTGTKPDEPSSTDGGTSRR